MVLILKILNEISNTVSTIYNTKYNNLYGNPDYHLGECMLTDTVIFFQLIETDQ